MTVLRSAGALIKPISSLAIACSALAGYLGTGWYRHQDTGSTVGDLAGLALGTFFLAAAGSIINQILEADLDARLLRTRQRPLVTKALSPRAATAIAALFIATGGCALFLIGPGSVPFLGLFGLAWYACVYTPLKRRTPFAVFPGTLVGMVPPAMGWLAGSCPSPALLIALCGVMGFGQLAHVGLQLLIHAEDSRDGPSPNLYTLLGPTRLLRFTDVMTLFTLGAATGCFRLSGQAGLIQTPLWGVTGLGALGLLGLRSRFSSWSDRPALERQFLALNLWIGLFLAAFAAGRA